MFTSRFIHSVLIFLITILCCNFASAIRCAEIDIAGLSKTADYGQKLIDEAFRVIEEKGITPKKVAADLGPSSWTKDGPRRSGYDPKANYEFTFKPLINKLGFSSEHFFDAYMKYLKLTNSPANVLELFGSGYFIENRIDVDSITAVRFEPYRITPNMVQQYKLLPTEILGDIIDGQAWQALDQSLAERGIDSLNFVMMRPEGGWALAPWARQKDLNLIILKYILGHVIKRLSPNGTFFFSIVLMSFPGKVEENPIMQEIVKGIAEHTPYELILDSSVYTTDNPEEYFSQELSGVLRSKTLRPGKPVSE